MTGSLLAVIMPLIEMQDLLVSPKCSNFFHASSNYERSAYFTLCPCCLHFANLFLNNVLSLCWLACRRSVINDSSQRSITVSFSC